MTSRSTTSRRGPDAKLRAILKPVGAREESAATKAGLERLRQEGKLASDARSRVIRVALAIEKPDRRDAEPQRLIEVLIADYSARRVHRLLLDARGGVIRGEELTYQPPFHADEVKEADRITRRDRRVARIARTRGAFASPFVPAAQEGERSRLVGLRYAVPARGEVVQVGTVVVDLSRRELVSFEGPTRRS